MEIARAQGGIARIAIDVGERADVDRMLLQRFGPRTLREGEKGRKAVLEPQGAAFALVAGSRALQEHARAVLQDLFAIQPRAGPRIAIGDHDAVLEIAGAPRVEKHSRRADVREIDPVAARREHEDIGRGPARIDRQAERQPVVASEDCLERLDPGPQLAADRGGVVLRRLGRELHVDHRGKPILDPRALHRAQEPMCSELAVDLRQEARARSERRGSGLPGSAPQEREQGDEQNGRHVSVSS